MTRDELEQLRRQSAEATRRGNGRTLEQDYIEIAVDRARRWRGRVAWLLLTAAVAGGVAWMMTWFTRSWTLSWVLVGFMLGWMGILSVLAQRNSRWKEDAD